MTKIKVQCIAVFLFVFVTDVISIHLLYDKNSSILTLFSFNEEPLAFQVDFTSSGIHLPQQVNEETHGLSFYIGKHKRNKVDLSKIIQMKGHERLKENIHFDYVKKSIKLGEDQTAKTFGKIGLKPQHNAFLEVIKLVNNANHIRLDYSHESQDLSIVFEQCTNPIKLPAMMRIQIQSLGKEQDVSLQKISNQFVPNSDFIQRVLGKNQLIFNLTVLEMEQQSVKVSINNHVQRIPLLKLLEPYCRRKGHSTMYHCDLEKVASQSSKSEYGGILMEFDFSICQRGVSIYSNHVQAQQTYFILHHILIFLVVLLGLVYNNDELCIRMIKKLLRKKKSY